MELVDDSNVTYPSSENEEEAIITNQIGYKPESQKIAIFRNISNEREFSVVDSIDFILLKQYLLDSTPLTSEQRKNADLNGDGNINALDFVELKTILLAKFTSTTTYSE